MNCRSCGSVRMGEVIDLGPMPLVNNLLRSADEPAPRWPLHVVYCRDCTLAQLTESPPPTAMFDDYRYFSSQSQTMVQHAAGLVDRYVQPGQRVLEIASNDGYLLRHAMPKAGAVLGIEPAANVASHARSLGVPTRCEYFDGASAKRTRDDWGQADVIFANNVLAHVPNPNELAQGIGTVLSDRGVAHVEVPSLTSMLASGAFDTIYHEHCCYFSLASLQALFARHGLGIDRADRIDIHGGSHHLHIHHGPTSPAVFQQIEAEHAFGVGDDACFRAFAERVAQVRSDVAAAVDRFEFVVGLGAAAKGVVLLNTLGLGTDRVRWVADVSPHKQGRFIPGTRQPIVPPHRLLDESPQAALVLAWNLLDELMHRHQAFHNQGGRFIVPIPSVRVV